VTVLFPLASRQLYKSGTKEGERRRTHLLVLELGLLLLRIAEFLRGFGVGGDGFDGFPPSVALRDARE
jgi:hypothetical protein